MTTPQDKPAQANTAVKQGDHDRVQMLSLHADGTPAQTPGVEMIGDPETSVEATKQQFREQAVSAADVQVRREQADKALDAEGGVGGRVSDKEDPQVEELQKAHQKASEAAEKAAESAVKKLHEEDVK